MKSFLYKLIIFLIVAGTGAFAGGYIALIQGVPQIEEIKAYIPSHPTRIYGDNDTLIGEFRVEKGEYAPIDKIPEYLIKAIVAVEDSRFWLHKGVDYIAVIRALSEDIRAGRIKQGASTITQQLQLL